MRLTMRIAIITNIRSFSRQRRRDMRRAWGINPSILSRLLFFLMQLLDWAPLSKHDAGEAMGSGWGPIVLPY